MAIPRMEDDVEIISKLGDVPGSDDGMSTQQLKAAFDLAAIRIKKYLNEILIPEMDKTVDVAALLNDILDTTLTQTTKAAQAKAVGDALEKKLDKTGGTMTGAIAMGGNKVTGVGTPSQTTDAANKDYVDRKYLAAQINLPASGWSAAAPYTQTVAVTGILATDTPHVGLIPSEDIQTALVQEENWGYVSLGITKDGNVTFTCFEDKPAVDLTIQLEVNR